MGTTKNPVVMLNSITLVPSAPQSAIAVINAGYGANMMIRNTNGATGPTVAASYLIEVSNDVSGVTFLNPYTILNLTSLTGNNIITDFAPIQIDEGLQAIRITASGNTVQNVTSRVELSNVTVI
jgi:hypothetical protein